MARPIYIPETDDPEMQKALSLIFKRLGGVPDIITMTANGDQMLGKALVIGQSGVFCEVPNECFHISLGGPEHFTPCPLCKPQGWSSSPSEIRDTKSVNIATARKVARVETEDHTQASDCANERLMASRPLTTKLM